MEKIQRLIQVFNTRPFGRNRSLSDEPDPTGLFTFAAEISVPFEPSKAAMLPSCTSRETSATPIGSSAAHLEIFDLEQRRRHALPPLSFRAWRLPR
jgi:hypothetical protein